MGREMEEESAGRRASLRVGVGVEKTVNNDKIDGPI